MNVKTALKEYGLKETQAKVYLACLELGSGSIQQITEKVSMPRSSCEITLELLQQRGLLTSHRKGKNRYFNAEDPKRILLNLKDRVSLFEQALPQFLSLYGTDKLRPNFKLYQGKTAIKSILDGALEEAKQLMFFASAEDVLTNLVDIWPAFVKKRIQKKILARVILYDSPTARDRRRLGPTTLRETRIIPSSYKFSYAMVMIWSNKLALFSLHDETAMLIEAKDLAEMHKMMFNYMWDTLGTGI